MTQFGRVWHGDASPWCALLVAASQLEVRLSSLATNTTASALLVDTFSVLLVYVAAKKTSSLSPWSAVLAEINNNSMRMLTAAEFHELMDEPNFAAMRVF